MFAAVPEIFSDHSFHNICSKVPVFNFAEIKSKVIIFPILSINSNQCLWLVRSLSVDRDSLDER